MGVPAEEALTAAELAESASVELPEELLNLTAPFSYFGGKRRVAADVWRRLGPVSHYSEPFAGSLAVLLRRPHHPHHEVVNDFDGYICVAPETRVLQRDLTWAAAESLRIGDSLLAFDEQNPGAARTGFRAPSAYRKWRHAVVLNAPVVKLPCYRLIFTDGTEVVASENHCWLAGAERTGTGGRGWRWVETKRLFASEKRRSWVLKVASPIAQEQTWEAGWLAGIFDGEGCIVGPPGLRIGLAQNPGVVLDTAMALLRMRGFDFEVSTKKRCQYLTLRGGQREQMRFLMLIRPRRLLQNFDALVEGCSLYGRDHHAVGLVAKEYVGEREVIALATSTKTFVAEGLASHNCNFWRAVKFDPEGLKKHIDWPVTELDLHARNKFLIKQRETLSARLREDPEFFDVRIAGWWVWGVGVWVGGSWAAADVHPIPRSIPVGVHAKEFTPAVIDRLARRLRGTQVVCGDWKRVVTPAYLGYADRDDWKATGVFLDPPYNGDYKLEYAVTGSLETQNSIFEEVWSWAMENGTNLGLRIAVCGYDDGRTPAEGWATFKWKATGGYGNQRKDGGKNENAERERIWFSPGCLPVLEDVLGR